MDARLIAIHETAIRLNSLMNSKALIGKSTENSEAQRSFTKAFGEALAATCSPAAILRQVSASLGSLERGELFLKAVVKDWDTEHRHKLAEHEIKGSFAGPHDSFPVSSHEDLTHAFMLAHHAKDPEAVQAKLRAIAKERGWEKYLPADEKRDSE